ncbi:hypothetical protein [Hydrogenophaga sp. IBVHS2]|uniref:hypothetical protein n=1 Tax=Hydrogenophaga sp. IBVHS2 TaxID=1985170 RepID=UPI000A2D7E63|nr:hypothetical protein [Hydrogenophaga sp. IBVHS2]OSZ64711.1 hypothetical protein CAP38_09930 [Hydrogenophaga sp. IBVHS2]
MQRLPGHTRTPYGRERVVLRRLPVWLLGGTLVPALSAGMARLWPWDLPTAELAARIGLIDILAIAVVILWWTGLFTVGIGAFIVMVMKGPAYVADAYPLVDADRPADGPVRESRPPTASGSTP